MRPISLLGFLMFRGGQLLAAGSTLYYGWWWTLRFWSLPQQLAVGLALVLTGFALVILSLIFERVRDARAEEWSR